MSPAALETCILDVFPNLNLESAQTKLSRKKEKDSEKALPRIVSTCGKSFEVGVPIALAQLFVKNYNGREITKTAEGSCLMLVALAVSIQCDGEMFFKTSGKALFSLITRHPDDKADCVELAKEALRRALVLGEPIRIHQRLTRYRNVLVRLTR